MTRNQAALRDARRDRGRRHHRGQRRGGPGRRRRAGRDAASRARTSARSRSRCPRAGSASSRSAKQIARRAGRRAGQALSRAGARDLAGGRSGDAHVRRARVRSSIPAPALQWGMTANVVARRRAARSGERCCRSTSVYQHDDGQPAVWVYDPADGKVALRPVVDRASTARTASSIGSGLAAGEWVVAAGVQQAARGPGGAAVRRRQARPPCRRRRRSGAAPAS